MRGRIFFILFGLLVVTHQSILANTSSAHYNQQLPDQNYVILYVETANQQAIDAFIAEMRSYPDKVIDVSYNYTTHEFTVIFTDLLRNDTIYQILLEYFEDFKEIDGRYPN
jgi:hypothetical protein